MNDLEKTIPSRLANLSAVEVFQEGQLPLVIAAVEEAARAIVLDPTTNAGRKEIASVAAKVARSKTFLDDLGKRHVAGLKAAAAEVDAQRRQLRDALDLLKAEIRAPLTEWENREAIRVQRHLAAVNRLNSYWQGLESLALGELVTRHQAIESTAIDESWEEFKAQGTDAKAKGLLLVGAAIVMEKEAIRIREAEAAEAAAKAAEIQAAREKSIAEAAALRATAVAEARAAQTAAAEASRAAVEHEALRRRMAHAVEIAEKAKMEAAMAASRERQRTEALARAEAEAKEQRAKDKAHATQVRRQAVAALRQFAGLTEDQARAVISQIHLHQIPNVRIEY